MSIINESKCDRCDKRADLRGKHELYRSTPIGWIRVFKSGALKPSYDLCPACYTKFLKWIETGKT